VEWREALAVLSAAGVQESDILCWNDLFAVALEEPRCHAYAPEAPFAAAE
jgi:hypothetical protein